MNKLLVLGIGNPLMADDGIGVEVARRLRNQNVPGIRVVEAGTPGYGLVDYLSSRPRVLFIDAVDGGHEPGSVFWVKPESLESQWGRQSLHQVGLNDVLTLLAMSGHNPWVGIIGVQPERVDAQANLSQALNTLLPEITNKVSDMIKNVL